MDSRKQFEEWFTDGWNWPQIVEKDKNGEYVAMQAVSAWRAWQVAWQAGRASMRDEAAEMAANQWLKDHMVSACDSIREIQP